MRKILLASAIIGLAGGFALAPLAHALETPDQAAAEGFVNSPTPPATSPSTQASPNNGLAQQRITPPVQETVPQSGPQQ